MGVTAESYAWPEGTLLVWTGTSSPFTAGYVSDSTLQLVYGWQNVGPSIGGTYTDHLTGQYATLSFAGSYSYDPTLERIHQSATAVHFELLHNGVNGSAGYKLFSGRIDSLSIRGQEGGLFSFSLACHANAWSAY